MLVLPATNHKILQVAYVVNDIEKAARHWAKTFGVGPFYLLKSPEVGNPIYRGRAGKVNFSAALAQAGDIHIELIEQHCDSPSCYRDLIPKGSEGFHHVAVIVDDYDKEVARYESIGCPVAASGEFGPLRFCYIDTSATMHGMVEVLEDLPFIRNYFARIQKASENWNGADLIRDASVLAG
jgi:hypothetical protein